MKHAAKPDNQQTLDAAASTCKAAGGRLTPKRRELLALLLNSEVPLSAYELADQYQQVHQRAIPVMSVYRILDFLGQMELVHKLQSGSKFLACSHIACDHQHEAPQFLICRRCGKVVEVGISSDMIAALHSMVEQSGFHMTSPRLELNCLCHHCATASS